MLAFLFLAGLFYGAISAKSGFASYYTSAVMRIYKNSSFIEISCYIFLSQLMLNVTVLFSSVSCIGAPVIAFAPFCSGYVNGCIFSYMTSQSGTKGAVGYFIMLWLPLFFQTLCMLYYAMVSMQTSVRLFRHHFLGEPHISGIKIKSSMYVFLIICLVEFVLSLLSGGFIKLFNPVFL